MHKVTALYTTGCPTGNPLEGSFGNLSLTCCHFSNMNLWSQFNGRTSPLSMGSRHQLCRLIPSPRLIVIVGKFSHPQNEDTNPPHRTVIEVVVIEWMLAINFSKGSFSLWSLKWRTLLIDNTGWWTQGSQSHCFRHNIHNEITMMVSIQYIFIES
jgi:hypothetical protein